MRNLSGPCGEWSVSPPFNLTVALPICYSYSARREISMNFMIRRLLSRRHNSEVAPIGGAGPRGFVGGLWHELGELQFRFLVEMGLRPDHVLLDIACGSLRGGVRFVPYLNPGNYMGIDIDAGLIEHGCSVELGETLCEIKKPEFVISSKFEFSKFSRQPDIAFAQSLFTHLIEADIESCLMNLRAFAKPTTVFYATFFEVYNTAYNPSTSHPHDAFRFTQNQMLKLGENTGWSVEYIGDWGHPRDQKMLRYTVAA